MTKYYHLLLLVFCLFFAVSCSCRSKIDSGTGTDSEPQASSTVDTDAIIAMLENGWKVLAGGEADDSDYGNALVRTTLERFVEHPGIAAEIKDVFSRYIDKDEHHRRYQQWSTLLDYLDASLIHCGDVDAFHAVWDVRREVIEELQQTVREINEVRTSRIQELTSRITELNRQIALERELTAKPNEDFSPATSGEENKGGCQRIIEDLEQVFNMYEDISIDYWEYFLLEDEVEGTSNDFRLDAMLGEIRHLQFVRYNLWAMQRLVNNTPTAHILSQIDTRLLVRSVDAIYAEKESEIMSDAKDSPEQLSENLRTLLTAPKVGLEAF